MFPLTKEPSDSFKSCSNVNTHAPGITLMFFSLLLSSLFLSWPLNAVPPMCAHCSLDSLAGSKTGTQHSCLLCCITHCLAVPVCVLFFLLFSRPLLTTNFFANSESSVVVVVVCGFFFHVVEGCCQPELKLHYIFRKRLPDVSFWSPACWVGVACHRALLSPQWLTTLSRGLPTDRCWLTNQQLSTTNLCCRPSRLTAFLCHSH